MRASGKANPVAIHFFLTIRVFLSSQAQPPEPIPFGPGRHAVQNSITVPWNSERSPSNHKDETQRGMKYNLEAGAMKPTPARENAAQKRGQACKYIYVSILNRRGE